MLWWLYELFSSVRFLTVYTEKGFFQSKRVYELVLPGVLSLVIFLLYVSFPQAFQPKFLSTLTSNTFQFMVFVVPFHLAALGAFATFDRPVLDQPLKGTNAEIKVWSNQDNDYFYQSLTLRQYVSLLFGYLCSLGIVFIVSYIFWSTFNVLTLLGEWQALAYKVAILSVVFFVAHYAFLSIYAITFLFDKVNGIGR